MSQRPGKQQDRAVKSPAEPEHDASELPEGWGKCRVGEVFKISSGGTPSRTESRYWNGNVPWLSSGDIKTDEIEVGTEFITEAGLQNSTAKLCEPGAVVVVVRSGVLKHTLPVAVLRRPAAINQDLKCFDSGSKDLNRWLALELKASTHLILSENREGTTVQSVKSETLREFELPLPPLAEQRRIVAKLEELLGKVSSSQQRLSRVPGLLKRFRQSVLAAACSGRLTPDWREENVQDNEYISTSLDEVADYVGGFAFRSPEFLRTGKHQVIRIGNVRPMQLDILAAPIFIPEEIAADTERFCLQPNDIVVSMTGTKYKRDYGHAAMIEGHHGSLFINQHVSRVRCGKTLLPRFLLYWMHSDLFRNHFFAGETGNVNQGNVGADGIRKAPIELPPLAEQQEIVRRVEKLFAFADQIEARLTQAQTHVDRITQSLLAKAFRGELVPTEHALAAAAGREYESATKLLGRVLASANLESHGSRKKKVTSKGT